MKKNKDLNWIELNILKIFGKIFDRFDDEDAEARADKSQGVKRINITWIIIWSLIIGFVVYMFNLK